MIFVVSLIFSGLSGHGFFIPDQISSAAGLFSHVSEFSTVYAFSVGGGGGGGGGPSTPQPSSGGSSGISSGKTPTPSISSGESSGISPGTTSANKQPNCLSQSCTGSNDATKSKPTSNTGSKNSIQGGSPLINSKDGSSNINTSPKVVSNPNSAIVTNPETTVNENNVEVNVEGTSNYYYYPQANSASGQESTMGTTNENPLVIYNNSILNPIMPVIKMVGANEGANTISGIEDGKTGQTLDLIGTSSKKYVQTENNVNVTLSHEPIILGQDDSLTLTFNADSGKWIETTHKDSNN